MSVFHSCFECCRVWCPKACSGKRDEGDEYDEAQDPEIAKQRLRFLDHPYLYNRAIHMSEDLSINSEQSQVFIDLTKNYESKERWTLAFQTVAERSGDRP